MTGQFAGTAAGCDRALAASLLVAHRLRDPLSASAARPAAAALRRLASVADLLAARPFDLLPDGDVAQRPPGRQGTGPVPGSEGRAAPRPGAATEPGGGGTRTGQGGTGEARLLWPVAHGPLTRRPAVREVPPVRSGPSSPVPDGGPVSGDELPAGLEGLARPVEAVAGNGGRDVGTGRWAVAKTASLGGTVPADPWARLAAALDPAPPDPAPPDPAPPDPAPPDPAPPDPAPPDPAPPDPAPPDPAPPDPAPPAGSPTPRVAHSRSSAADAAAESVVPQRQDAHSWADGGRDRRSVAPAAGAPVPSDLLAELPVLPDAVPADTVPADTVPVDVAPVDHLVVGTTPPGPMPPAVPLGAVLAGCLPPAAAGDALLPATGPGQGLTAIDPDDLAALVNEALVEQARRHGREL